MVAVQSPTPSLPLWTVGVPKQTQIPDPTRGYIAGWEVPVIMADGSTFTVTVAADQFNPKNVLKVIEEHVGRLVEVRALEGPRY